MTGCRIQLKNHKEYHPEDNVEASVIWEFPTTVKGIVVELIGEERTSWRKIVNYGTTARADIRTEKSEGYNKFLLLTRSFFPEGGFEPGGDNLKVCIMLPEDIPGSFQSERGCVRFYIKATGYSDSHTSSFHTEKDITIISPIPTNADDDSLFGSVSSFNTPYSQSVEKIFRSLCCTGDTAIVMDVYLPKRSFIQGERAKILVDVSNSSDEKVDRIELIMGLTIESKGETSGDGSKFDHSVLLAVKKNGSDERINSSYEFDIEIPKIPVVPNFTRCKLFKKRCWIDVIAVVKDNFETKVTTFIIIGQVTANEPDHAGPTNKVFSRSTSRSRDQVGGRNYRSLLPSKGPAPYSSYKQRPAGFGMAQPIRSDTRPPTMPLPPDRSPVTSEAYPPTAGPAHSHSDVPQKSPPTYEDAVRSDVYATNSQASSQALSLSDPIPSAPAGIPDSDTFVEQKFTSSVRSVSGSAPYPSEAPPPACDSIGFVMSTGSSLGDGRFMPMPSMPIPRTAPYPPEIPTLSSTNSTSMPLPPHLNSTSAVSHTNYTPIPFPNRAPYPTDAPSRWDQVREGVPHMVGTQQFSSPTLYPPERPSPSVNSHYTPMAMPMPMPIPKSDSNASSRGNSGGATSAPYPVDSPLQISGTIGFAVLENAGTAPTNGRPSASSAEPF